MPTVPELVMQTASAHGVDPRLAFEVASKESAFKQTAISPKGAIGVMQLMPATAAQLGVNPHNLADNIKGGVIYLRQQLTRFGDTAKALAAYNCGPGCVAQAIAARGSEWFTAMPGETRNYVQAILGRLGEWQATLQVLPAAAAQSVSNASQQVISAARNVPFSSWLLFALGGLVIFWVLDDA